MKSCQPREMGLMRHRFNSTLQVTGLRDAIPLAPPLASPNNTQTHSHTHTQRSKKQELVKVKKNRRKGRGGEEKVGR